MGQYGYNPGNAATFNQLVRTGITEEEAAAQSGVSTNASQYGFGTNSNAGAVIPGAGGATNAAGLTTVPYAQSASGLPIQESPTIATPSASSGFGYGTGINNPSVAPVQAAEPAPSPITETPSDSRVISSTPNASSGFGYGTGIDNPSVAPVAESTVKSFAATDVSSSFVQAPGETGRGTVPTPAPAPLSPASLGKPGESVQAQAAAAAGTGTTPIGAETATPASNTVAGKLLAQRQQELAAQKRLINNTGDWRVRISLAESSDYLYNAPFLEEGILAPLKATFGVIFPYTPKIDISYRATYSTADLTHSNYRNYFYQGSAVDSVRITGTFTAQDTVEANYMLAVIHFFRSATKMFYGQDAQRGAPPPLLFISGLGEYQLNNHPCVLSSFDYNLPADVDYIRAGSPNNNGTDLLKRRTSTQNNLPTNPISGALSRLTNILNPQGIQKGGIVYQNPPSNLSKNSPTYVPTKLDISLNLYPVVTRSQASKQFSLKQFANGDLVKQGFW